MFAERLKEARKAKRYSQAEVSKMLGVTQQAVGKWETGRSTPDPQTVARLAEILDTPSDVLLGLRKEPGVSAAVGRNAFSRYTESQIPVVGTVRRFRRRAKLQQADVRRRQRRGRLGHTGGVPGRVQRQCAHRPAGGKSFRRG